MYKINTSSYKLLTAGIIATLMITALFASLATTTANPSQPSISPEKTGASRWVVLTLTVDSDADDNIAKIVLVQSNWDEPMGGDNSTFHVAENWENVADNMTEASTELSFVVENLRIAVENKKSASYYLENAGDDLYDAGTEFMDVTAGTNATTDYSGYVGPKFQGIHTLSEKVFDALKSEPENLTKAGTNLKLIGTRILEAAENISNGENAAENPERIWAADNLIEAGNEIENAGENYLAGGNFGTAAELLDSAADNMYSSTWSGTSEWGDGVSGQVLNYLKDAQSDLRAAATRLAAASDRLNDAGLKLSDIKGFYLDNALSIAKNVTGTAKTYLGDNFSDNIGGAGAKLSQDNAENILSAGENLRKAGLALNAVTDLDKAMLDFGSKYLTLRSDSVDNLLVKAGDNLRTASTVDLTTAASLLKNAASQLGEAASVLSATAGKLKPSNWELSRPQAGQAQFKAENSDYYIAPGAAAKEFVFLWKAPSASGTYKFDLYAYDEDGNQEYVDLEFDSIETDGTMPSLEVLVARQPDVITFENNIVTKDNAKLVIKASEPLSDLGSVTIENEGTFVGPLSMTDLTTTDNTRFEYTFSVGEWDDNSPVDIKIAGPWATDEYGNENSSSASAEFFVDTRAPILLDNGLTALQGALVGQKVQAGTGNKYWVDNNADQIIEGNVEDNSGARLGYENYDDKVVSVTIEWDNNSLSADPMLTPDNGFTKSFNLSEGLNSFVRVIATDWVGNTTDGSDNLENIFIDTTAPSINSWKLNGSDWTDNGQVVNSGQPTIGMTISDAGLGVAYENLKVILDNDDNILNDGAYGTTLADPLDNASPYEWDATAGQETWENTIENSGGAFVDGVYWIGVVASDNIAHAGSENVVLYRSFRIDTAKPSAPSDLAADVPMGTLANPAVIKETMVTMSGSAELSSWESSATIKVYTTTDGGVTWTEQTAAQTTTDAEGNWNTTVSLTSGQKTGIAVTAVDEAGNESSRELFGYVLSDGSAPTVSITSPESGATTDKVSIEVKGTVTKDNWEEYSDLTLTLQVGTGSVTVPVSSDGSFTYSVALSEGTNSIVAWAEDVVPNRSDASTVTVTRTVTPWAMYAAIGAIIAIILAAIAVLRRGMGSKGGLGRR